MAELKTKVNNASVTDFLNGIKDEAKRIDSFEIVKMMQQITKQEPRMWGTSIIGFGNTHLKYESGRELDWFVLGFSPRKQNLTLYGMGNWLETDLVKKLGKYKTGKGCLYINQLEDVNIKVLKELLTQTIKATKKL
jgi:hypothetical protein